MLRAVLFTALVGAQWVFALPRNCETLLQSKPVLNTVGKFFDQKLSKKVVLKLRGHYKSLTASDLRALKAIFLNDRGHANLEKVSEEEDGVSVEIRLSGSGKGVARKLIALNAQPVINKAYSWNAWQPGPEESKVATAPAPISEEEMQARLLIPIRALNVSIRTYNALRNDNFLYVGEVVCRSARDLKSVPNFGQRSLDELKDKLNDLGLKLGMTGLNWPPEEIPQFVHHIALDWQPVFEISDWAETPLPMAEQTTKMLEDGSFWIMTSSGKKVLALTSPGIFERFSNKRIAQLLKLQTVNKFGASKASEDDIDRIGHLRERIKAAPAMALAESLRPDVLQKVAESDGPVLVQTRSGNLLVLLPIATMFQ